jgi:hypothetical protein
METRSIKWVIKKAVQQVYTRINFRRGQRCTGVVTLLVTYRGILSDATNLRVLAALSPLHSPSQTFTVQVIHPVCPPKQRKQRKKKSSLHWQVDSRSRQHKQTNFMYLFRALKSSARCWMILSWMLRFKLTMRSLEVVPYVRLVKHGTSSHLSVHIVT